MKHGDERVCFNCGEPATLGTTCRACGRKIGSRPAYTPTRSEFEGVDTEKPWTGTVKWWSSDKGYGFVTSSLGSDLFVHHSFLADQSGFPDLEEGEPVSYKLTKMAKGPAAVEVIRANASPPAPEEDLVFLLDENGNFRSLPCIRGPAGHIIIEGKDLASILADASVPHRTTPRLRRVCAEFEQLINAPKISESALQEFLEEYPEFLLANQFEALYPQVVLPGESSGATLRPDFILRPIAGVSYEPEIVELKLPHQPVVKLNKDHVSLYDPITKAVGQLQSYARAFEDDQKREEIAQSLGMAAHRPTLALIVGRSRDLPSSRQTALAKEMVRPIRLQTYDDLLLQFRKRHGLD
jgi:cold shock protein